MLGKIKVAGLLVLMLVASVLAGAAAPVLATNYVLTVNVFDGSDLKTPIAADSVDVYDGNTLNLVAHRAGGEVVYISLAEGLYKVDVAKENYETYGQYVSVEGDMPITAYLHALPDQDGQDQGAQDGAADSGQGDGQVAEEMRIKLNIEPDDEVKPGEEVEFEVELDNKLGYNADEVNIELTVKDIDDGDDWDDEKDIGGLDKGDEETETFDFKVPYDADEDDYTVKVEVTWEDDLGKQHKNTLTDTLGVEKEKHDVAIINAYLGSETVAPGRTAELAVELANIGKNDEDVRIKVASQDLDVEEWSAQFELEDGKTVTQYMPFTVPKDAEAGKYFVYVTTYFNSGVDSASEFVTLTVEESTAGATGAVSLTPVVTTVAGEGAEIGFTDDTFIIGGLVVGILVLLAVIAFVAKGVMPRRATIVESTRKRR